jgi:hypothetical protein
METMLIPVAVIAVVLIKLIRRYDVNLFKDRGAGTEFRSAAAGEYSQIATLAVLGILVLIALNPESSLFFMSVDAIGFDLLVALFTLQFRSVVAIGWQFGRQAFVSVGECIWRYGVAPRRKLQVSTAVASMSYVGTWINAHLVAR